MARRRSTPTDRDTLLERVRALCLAQPGAIEKPSHGAPTWFTPGSRGRVFAMFDDHHHGAEHVSVHVAATHEVQAHLIAEQPARYFVPPYVGGKGWVGVVIDVDPDWNTLAQLLHEAFAMVAQPRPRRR
ncbi:MAG: MmcQ/YjbR family DNA-binding protein [Nannocystaceae bacterium]|nr:MmcQ/YjbR family DNA-binding protein [Nannocystaceae bacterium]